VGHRHMVTRLAPIWIGGKAGRKAAVEGRVESGRSQTAPAWGSCGAAQAPVAPLVPVIGGDMRRRKLLVALAGLVWWSRPERSCCGRRGRHSEGP